MTATTAREFLQKTSLRPATTLKRERDMLARRLADVSHQRGELKMLCAKAITVLARHKEHADCRALAADLAKRLETLSAKQEAQERCS